MRVPVAILFCVLAYWTLVGLQMAHVADDPGLGWHLLTGEWIATMGAPPLIDPFLASAEPRPWIADQWLSDLLMALLWRYGGEERGMTLLYAGATSVFLLVFMGFTYRSAMVRSGSPLWAGVAAFFALKLASVHFILRPVIIGFIFFAVVSGVVWQVVERVRQGSDVRVRDVGVLVPLTALWANMHPSFGLGIIMIALTTIGLVYDTVVIQRRPFAARSFLVLGGTCGFMALASLLNPYGIDLVCQVFGLVNDDFFMSLNQEWRPIQLRNPEGRLFLQTGIVILLGAFLSPRREATISFTEPLIIGFFAWSTLSSVRFLPYYAIAATPLLAQSMGQIAAFEPFQRLPPYRQLRAVMVDLDKRERRGFATYLCLLVALVCFPLIDAVMHGTMYPYRGSFGPSREEYPYDGISALRDVITRDSLSQPIAVVATPDWGGFLALHGREQFKPIIDDRNSLLGAQAYKEFMASVKIGGDIVGYLKRMNAQFLLLKANEPLAIYLRDTGKLRERWRGEVSALFEPQTSSTDP